MIAVCSESESDECSNSAQRSISYIRTHYINDYINYIECCDSKNCKTIRIIQQLKWHESEKHRRLTVGY